MAEVSAVLPVAPEVTGSSSVKSRRNSIAKGSPGNIEDVVGPHYRRASVGSCHDFCKYGRKQASEVKEKYSVSSRVQRNPLGQSSEADVNGVNACVANRRKSIGSKPPRKASTVKLRESDDSEPNEKGMPTKLADSPKQGRSEVSVAKKKTSVVKLKTIFHRKSHAADLPQITIQGKPSISAKLVGTSSKPTLGLVRDSSEATVEPVETSKSIPEQPVETSLKSTTEPVEASSESIMDPVGIPSISMVEPVKGSSKATQERMETSSQLNVEPVEISSTLTLEPMANSSESIMDPVGVPSRSMVEPVKRSPKSTPEPVETSSKLIAKPVETSSIFTVEVTSSKSSMVPLGIPSISTMETVECSSKSTPKLVETSSKLIAEPVETSSILTVEPTATSSESSMVPVGIPSRSTVECTSKSTPELVETSSILTVGPMVTLSESIMEQVGSSSKSCKTYAEAASKPTAEPVAALPKSIAKKEDISSKSTVKKVRALSKLTPKKLEASPKTPAKKVGASPKLTPQKMEASPKSTTQKVEILSKSSIKKLEAQSKSIAKKKPAAKKAETSRKSADKKEEMSTKSTAKVVTSSKSAAKAGISSESVVKKVVTVKNVENSMVQTLSKPTPLKAKQMKLSRKHVAPLKSNSITVNPVSSMNPSEGSNGQSNSKLKMVKRSASLKVEARKLMTPSRAALPSKSSLNNNGVVSIDARKHKSLKMASHVKNQLKTRKSEHKKPGNDAVEEKTLYVIKMESGNISLQTDRDAGNDVEFSPQSSSPPKFSVNLEGGLTKNGEALEVKDISEPRMVGIVSSEDKASQMSKLNFRRGKLVELQSEVTSPRRLKFRRAKGFGENAMVNADSLRRSFKKRCESGNDRMSTPTGKEKVVLRRQGTRGERDGHGLFNNVIEETATKLAETRKSKVKALVGAFETVISLQERNPVAKTVG